jgi:hypothetical protein
MSNSWIIKHPGGWEALFIFLRKQDVSKPVEIRWGPPRRSNKQNNYLWGVVYKTLAEGMSEQHKALVTLEMVHELCRQYFAPRVDVPGTGQTVPMSTTELCRSGNEDSFQDYVVQIQELGAKKGIYISDPNEETK